MIPRLRHRPLDPPPTLAEFVGLVNTKRSKAYGFLGLAVATNVELTDEKRLTRRDGYTQLLGDAFAGLYGSADQSKLLAVRQDGVLELVLADGTAQTLQTGLLPGTYSWDEDPANNVYYANGAGSCGIVLTTGQWLPLALPVPLITAAAAIENGPWDVRPFNLGAKYTTNAMQVFATYLLPDGRESAPSPIESLAIAPTVKLLRLTVPVATDCLTCVYATAPGGSRYYRVATSANATFTFPVDYLNMNYAGPDYPYSTVLDSFPATATHVAHWGGRLYAAVLDSNSRLGTVYASLPQQYHLFDFTQDFFSTSGPVLLLLSAKDGLVIGTDSNIYLWDGERMQQLADYGVPPGLCGDLTIGGDGRRGEKAVFWTLRGPARAMPYELLTEGTFSADPGVFNNAKVVYDRGYAKLIASTVAGNAAWNAWRVH